ncbi:MAG: HAD hydrolase-like protein [Planctomycetes bacterium]|nr:HAD hydrolase-like protein [Planctomycetota bacterium]
MHTCLLDIDGTLIDTGGAGQTAFSCAFEAAFGIAEISREVIFAGRSDRAIAMDFFRIHGVEPTTRNWRRFRTSYLASLEAALPTHPGRVLPGVVGLLEALAARGDVMLGLLTGNVREGARKKLSHYNLWHWFACGGFGDDHVDRNDIASAALDAARAHHGAESLRDSEGREFRRNSPTLATNCDGNGQALRQVVVIGDTLSDIECGRSIAARCVAVPTGNTPAEALRQGQPDVLVDTLEDWTPILSLFDGPSP